MRDGVACFARMASRVVGGLLLFLRLCATRTLGLEWQAVFDSEVPITCGATHADAGTYVGGGEVVFRLGEAGGTEVLERAGHEVSAIAVDGDGTLFVGWATACGSSRSRAITQLGLER